MSIQDKTNETLDTSRRGFTKLGVGAPVILSLASQPVLGAACLSGMMSGNLSNHEHDGCVLGWSPGGWCNPVGQVNGMDTIAAWAAAGFPYGVFDINAPGCNPNGQPQNSSSCYSGGATVNDLNTVISGLPYPSTIMPGSITGGAPGDTPLREIVCDPRTYNYGPRHCVTAFLNASLLPPPNGYVLTQVQVVGICTEQLDLPPGYSSINEFLDSTWT